MQKLVWQNANGDSIDLTSGNYGITQWEGFSNTSLNIQSQQVPFQDGAVFLDALLNQRELSVTLKMQDKGNLEERYRMRRELIHALNPKLGEGYLIYTNDFISKRIKCVAQVPLFETHNSDTRGTPKASLSWTATIPYWEDLEENEVILPIGEKVVINNNGDVPCNVKIEIESIHIGNPIVRNTTNAKGILLEDVFFSSLEIDTKTGEKKIIGKDVDMIPQITNSKLTEIEYNYVTKKYYCYPSESNYFAYSENKENWSFIKQKSRYKSAYSESLGYFIQAGYYETYKSYDGIKWELLEEDTPFQSYPIVRVEKIGLFFAIGANELYSSPNGSNWQKIAVPEGYTAFFGQCINDKLYICSQSNYDCYIYDGYKLTQINLKPFYSIQYISELQKYIAECRMLNYIQTSTDGITWQLVDLNGYRANSIGWNGSKLLINATKNGNNYWLESSNGTSFTLKGNAPYKFNFLYFEEGTYTGCGNGGLIANSTDSGDTWNIMCYNTTTTNGNVSIIDSQNKTFILFDNGALISTTNGNSWNVENPNTTLVHFTWIKEKNLYIGFNGSAIVTSADGVTWTQRKTTSYAGKFIYSKKLNKIISVYGVYDSNTDKTTLHTLTSSNGTSWSDTTGIIFDGYSEGNFMNIAYSEMFGVFIVNRDGDYNEWFRSSNGTTWVRYSNSNVYINNIIRVDRDGYFYSFFEKMYKSSDGIDWESITLADDVYVDSGAFSDDLGLYVVVAEYSGTNINPAFFISPDGVHWVRYKYDSGNGTRFSTTLYSTIIGRFLTGNNTSVSYLMASGDEKNYIATISKDSDIGLNLEVGENNLICSKTVGFGVFKIKYRQKYAGA